MAYADNDSPIDVSAVTTRIMLLARATQAKILIVEEMFARIHAAFNTVNLRRALREAQLALAQKKG